MGKKLLVMAGGTGGHVFPGLAVAQYLKDKSWAVEWLGTRERMEAGLVPKHGFDIHFIDVAGVRGNGVVRLLKAPFMVLHAILQAFRLMRKSRPDAVLGMGGYASGPGGIAAWLLGIPLILHEQNATPGLTNKWLAPFARKVLTGFAVPSWKLSADKIRQVGNPVRAGFIDVSEKEQVSGSLNILICGGSLGARVLNQQVPKALQGLPVQEFSVWHQAGKGNGEQVHQHYLAAGISDSQVKVAEFIDDMNAAYDWADIVICRAGALTVSEVALAGRCAIFVPLPHAVDDHQTKNAEFLTSHKAGFLLPQADLESDKLTELLADLQKNKQEIVAVSKRARQLANANATQVVAEVCEQCAGEAV